MTRFSCITTSFSMQTWLWFASDNENKSEVSSEAGGAHVRALDVKIMVNDKHEKAGRRLLHSLPAGFPSIGLACRMWHDVIPRRHDTVSGTKTRMQPTTR